MAYKIIWLKTAEKEFDKIVDYIENEWGVKTASKFTVKSNEIFNLLGLYPEAGSVEIREKNIRGFLITKQIRLFYRIKTKNLILLNFFDNRLNPGKKLKKYKKWKQ